MLYDRAPASKSASTFHGSSWLSSKTDLILSMRLFLSTQVLLVFYIYRCIVKTGVLPR